MTERATQEQPERATADEQKRSQLRAAGNNAAKVTAAIATDRLPLHKAALVDMFHVEDVSLNYWINTKK